MYGWMDKRKDRKTNAWIAEMEGQISERRAD